MFCIRCKKCVIGVERNSTEIEKRTCKGQHNIILRRGENAMVYIVHNNRHTWEIYV